MQEISAADAAVARLPRRRIAGRASRVSAPDGREPDQTPGW